MAEISDSITEINNIQNELIKHVEVRQLRSSLKYYNDIGLLKCTLPNGPNNW